MFAAVSAAMRFVLFIVMTLLGMIVYMPLLGIGRGYRAVARAYWRLVAGLVLRMDVVVHGEVSRERPLLCVSNHMSYLDIVALGTLMVGSFVSKAEVRTWPGFGFLAWLGRTVFIDRRPSETRRNRDLIAARLRAGEPLILFPEGTSTDGNRVLRFRSALFNAAEMAAEDAAGGLDHGGQVFVQPVALAYTRVGGLPMGYEHRAHYAWYGDMDLVTHLWGVLIRPRSRVEIMYLPAVAVSSFPDRKALAAYCEAEVRRAVNGLLSGNFRAPTPVPGTAAALPVAPPS